MTDRAATKRRVAASTATGFRGDIQGLRAIAVLIVIAGHAGLPLLPGGFVGVDVFFVISGFLISDLLYREIDRSQRISLADFYARRARRILPAATFVSVVTVVASAALISLVDARDVVIDAVWATFFAANVRFASVGTDYFAQEQIPSPLQHYWSLAVEEQFYLAWPLLLLLCVWLAHRRTTSVRRTAAWVLLGVGVVSFGYGLWLTHTSPAAAYFSTPARAWELAIGALAALVAHRVARSLTARARGLLAAGGLLAILMACLRYDEGTAFPGAAALLPVLGSAAVLVAGAGRHAREPLPLRALAVAPLRRIGDWSFSLYLWHWPLLVVPWLRTGERLSWPGATAAIAATFVLAALTYRFVETPFRSSARVPRPRALALYPVSIVLVGAVAFGALQYGDSRAADGPAITIAGSGLLDTRAEVSKDPTVALVQASVQAARNGQEIPGDLRPDLTTLRDDRADPGECDYRFDRNLGKVCARGETDAERTLVVLGDSHGLMWVPAFERIAEHAGWRTYYFVKPNCTAADAVVSEPDDYFTPWATCTDFREWSIEQVADLRPDLVVVSTTAPGAIHHDDGTILGPRAPGHEAAVQQAFADLLARLTPLSERVVLLGDVPRSDQEPGPCLTTGSADLGSCLFTPLAPRLGETEAAAAGAKEVGVEVVDPTPWLCWEGRCAVVVGDYLSYRDRDHLSTDYAAELGDDLGRALGIWSD